MSDSSNLDPEFQVKQPKKSVFFWKGIQSVLGASFGTFFFALVLLSGWGVDSPMVGVSHRDRQGHLVTEPDWPLAIKISLVLSGVAAGLAMWVCLRGNHEKRT
jgi:hypothetical protein